MHRLMSMMKRVLGASLVLLGGVLLSPTLAQDMGKARERIWIVGSSTIQPFIEDVARRYTMSGIRRTPPRVESTGSGAGIEAFCVGIGMNTPDIVKASRAMTKQEIIGCHANGVNHITAIKIGFDGVVLAQARRAPSLELTLREVFLGLAAKVPDPQGSGALVGNPYMHWGEINPDLPDMPIRVVGPPATSGTRDVFVELAMAQGCAADPGMRAVRESDPAAYEAACRALRGDGAYITSGEDDAAVLRLLERDSDLVGVIGYNYLDRNMHAVKGASIAGVRPTFEAIASQRYPLSRPLYVYVKGAHLDVMPNIREFLYDITDRSSLGPEGALVRQGLVPLGQAELYEAGLLGEELPNNLR